jgi:hypothetical protein
MITKHDALIVNLRKIEEITHILIALHKPLGHVLLKHWRQAKP